MGEGGKREGGGRGKKKPIPPSLPMDVLITHLVMTDGSREREKKRKKKPTYLTSLSSLPVLPRRRSFKGMKGGRKAVVKREGKRKEKRLFPLVATLRRHAAERRGK